jgi:hypothetical protein
LRIWAIETSLQPKLELRAQSRAKSILRGDQAILEGENGARHDRTLLHSHLQPAHGKASEQNLPY